MEAKSKFSYLMNVCSMPKKDWSKYYNPADKKNNLATESAINLLNRMLVYDPAERITPREALQHEYFKELRTDLRYKTLFGNK